MKALARVRSFLGAVLRRARMERDMDREMRFHLEARAADLVSRGVARADAERIARDEFGDMIRWKEAGRHARGLRALDEVRADLRDGARSLRRRPLTTCSAVATLAIGIGLNAAMFSVVDWVLLRPLPYPSPEDLVRTAELTYSEFEPFSRARAFRAATGFSTATRVVSSGGAEPAHAVLSRVAGDLFGTLGVYPGIGRGFTRDEMAAGAPVVVVSEAVWRNRLGADASAIGRTLAIDGAPHAIAGVMPAGRGYPAGTDLWRPLTAGEREDNDRELVMIARLATGVSAERASVELATLAGPPQRDESRPAPVGRNFSSDGPARQNVPPPGAERASARLAPAGGEGGSSGSSSTPAWVESLHRTDVRDVSAALTALWASAAFILLMACANVAALIGARGADRAGEMAVRSALGASRGRLVRQLLTESMLLALAGGTAGLVLGRWALDLLVTMAPRELPRLAEIALDGRIVLLGLAATMVVGVAVGLAPSFHASRLDLRSILGLAAPARTSRGASGRRILVATQVAIAVVLTIGAGLLGRSLQHLVTVDHGFHPDRLLAVDLYLRGVVTGDVRQLYRELVDAAETVPGVRSASVALRLPTQVAGLRVPVAVGRSFTGRRAGDAVDSTPITLRPVTPRYFETAGIPIIDGRVFTPSDRRTAPRVAIVNAAFVRDMLGGGRAVGTTLTSEIADGPIAVVGVVADVTPAGESDRAALYVPMDQLAFGGGSLLVKTAADPQSGVTALTSRLRAVAPALALDRIHAVADLLETGRAATRFNTRIASAFATLALLLAAIGVYGLTAGQVSARWRELAVRLALGATRGEALWTVMRPGAGALAAGVIAGVGATLGLGRWMGALLHGVEPADPPTLLAVPVLLGIVGLVSAALAGARVLRNDPAATLRTD